MSLQQVGTVRRWFCWKKMGSAPANSKTDVLHWCFVLFCFLNLVSGDQNRGELRKKGGIKGAERNVFCLREGRILCFTFLPGSAFGKF